MANQSQTEDAASLRLRLENEASDAARRRQAKAAAVGDYQPGSIMRVLVEDFVTYSHAVFRPGPNLNMVIGPNGTGKSSLVCAICLGLGYPSSVLGRAASFGDFVKHGKDFALVEIELCKLPDDDANFVVRMRIRREDNTRKFWLNGKDVALKVVQSLMRRLRIQVDNLCQFLPQDKVAEFAGLSPVDLLAKTLQAAAEPQMIVWHSELKQIYVDHREARQGIANDASALRDLERRQEAMKPDMDRLRERREIEKTIKRLGIARLLAAYTAARKIHREARDRRFTAMGKLKQFEADVGPTMMTINHKQAYAGLSARRRSRPSKQRWSVPKRPRPHSSSIWTSSKSRWTR